MMVGVTLILAIISAFLGITLGSTTVSLTDFCQALAAGDSTNATYRIVMHIRLPRVLAAILSGSALAVSGAILQAVLGNPLASPNVIGVNTGAGLFVLLCSALLPGSAALLPFAAFLGALLTALLIFALAMGSGVSQIALVLTGIAMSSILGAGMNCIMILYPDAYIGASNFLVGGLAGITLDNLVFPSMYIAVGLVLALLLRQDMNLITMGESAAHSLGMNVPWVRFLLILTSAILAGAAVSFAGLIGFVGLVVPHTLRFIMGSNNRYLVPASIFGGSAFVCLSDLAARTLFAPYELPVGILLSFIGGPFFIYLVIRAKGGRRD